MRNIKNQRGLYNSIMRNVAKEVHKAINEAKCTDGNCDDDFEFDMDEDVDPMPDAAVDMDVEPDDIEDGDEIPVDLPSEEDLDDEDDLDDEEDDLDDEEDDDEFVVKINDNPKTILKTEMGKKAQDIIDGMSYEELEDFAIMLNSKKKRKEERDEFINALIVLSKDSYEQQRMERIYESHHFSKNRRMRRI